MKFSLSLERWFFSCAALEAGAALLVLFLVPHEGGGFSLTRLGMFGILVVFFVASVYFAVRPPKQFERFVRPAYALIFALLAVTLGWLLFFLRYLDPEHLLPYYQRVAPILFYIFILAIQSCVFILLARYGFHPELLSQSRSSYRPALLTFIIALCAVCLIVVTRLGITPDPAYWGEPGVPLLGWQFVLAILIGAAILIMDLRFNLDNGQHLTFRIDAVFAVLIGMLALILWLSVPMSVMQNSFYAPMTPPSNQPFPNSDAAYYDSHALSLLFGMGYLGDIPTRPLYILFLAFLHILFGQNYVSIIAGQTCVLALIPVLFYFLGKEIHSRTAGVMIALFAIFREWTTLWVSSATRVSDTRTLLTDLPTLLMIGLACLFVVRWLKHESLRRALIAGGIFGLLLLLRTQSMIILPLVVLLTALIFWPRWRAGLQMVIVFALGIAVAVTPWLIHNYVSVGKFTFDDPKQLAVISSQYALSGNLDISQFNIQSQSLAGNLISFTIKHPAVVAQFIANHFLATEIGGVLALPLIKPFQSLRAPIDIYWYGWGGHLEGYNLLIVILYLAVVSIGIGVAWKRLRWIGLTPLVFSFGYALANGIARFSGWRYDLPADWISYFYFGIGMVEIIAWIAILFDASAPSLFANHESAQDDSSIDWKFSLPVLAGFALIGSLPWMAEHAVPPHYSTLPETSMVQQASQVPIVKTANLTEDQLNLFLSQDSNPAADVLQGRLLYPRFFWRGLGIAQAHPSPAYEVRDYPRLGFLLMINQTTPFVFPSKVIPPDFPDSGDVIVFGCRHSDYVEARLIIFPTLNRMFQADSPLVHCTN